MTPALTALGARARGTSFGAVLSGDVVGTAATRGIVVVFGVVSSMLTSRLLQPEGRGEYFWVVTIAQMLVQFSNLGLQSSNTYLVARDRERLGALLGNCLSLSIVAGGILAIAAAALLRTFDAAAPTSVWVIVALTPAMLLQLFTTNLLVGIGEIGWFNRVQLVSNLGVVAAMLAAGAAGLRAPGFLVVVAGAWLATGVWAVTVVRRRGGLPRLSFAFDREMFRIGFRYAAKAYLATLCGFLVLRSNVFALKAVAGYQEIGYFSVAAQIADLLAILPQSVALVLFPALVSAPAAAWERTARQALAVAVTLGAASVAAAVFAPVFVPLLFGEAFAPAVPVLRWLLPAAFFTGVTSVVSQYAAAAGFPKSLVAVWLVGLLFAVASSWVLIPRFSGEGAAMALSLTQAVIFALILGVCFQIDRRRSAALSPGV